MPPRRGKTDGGPTRIVPARLTREQIEKMGRLAAANDRGLSGEIRRAVREYLQRAGANG